jgi:hypothetical protein
MPSARLFSAAIAAALSPSAFSARVISSAKSPETSEISSARSDSACVALSISSFNAPLVILPLASNLAMASSAAFALSTSVFKAPPLKVLPVKTAILFSAAVALLVSSVIAFCKAVSLCFKVSISPLMDSIESSTPGFQSFRALISFVAVVLKVVYSLFTKLL